MFTSQPARTWNTTNRTVNNLQNSLGKCLQSLPNRPGHGGPRGSGLARSWLNRGTTMQLAGPRPDLWGQTETPEPMQVERKMRLRFVTPNNHGSFSSEVIPSCPKGLTQEACTKNRPKPKKYIFSLYYQLTPFSLYSLRTIKIMNINKLADKTKKDHTSLVMNDCVINNADMGGGGSWCLYSPSGYLDQWLSQFSNAVSFLVLLPYYFSVPLFYSLF